MRRSSFGAIDSDQYLGLRFTSTFRRSAVVEADQVKSASHFLTLLDNALNYGGKLASRSGYQLDALTPISSSRSKQWTWDSAHRQRTISSLLPRSQIAPETRRDGLGLSIVKHTIQAHGGTVSLEAPCSVNFTIVCPIARPNGNIETRNAAPVACIRKPHSAFSIQIHVSLGRFPSPDHQEGRQMLGPLSKTLFASLDVDDRDSQSPCDLRTSIQFPFRSSFGDFVPDKVRRCGQRKQFIAFHAASSRPVRPYLQSHDPMIRDHLLYVSSETSTALERSAIFHAALVSRAKT